VFFKKRRMTATPPQAPATVDGKLSRRKLPLYFPTYEPACREVAETFFRCFEENGKMKSNKDTTSCKQAIDVCAAQLDAYEQCMTKALARANRPWWKVWG
jgi:hypothetical protein